MQPSDARLPPRQESTKENEEHKGKMQDDDDIGEQSIGH
jgi:hypothetical protein